MFVNVTKLPQIYAHFGKRHFVHRFQIFSNLVRFTCGWRMGAVGSSGGAGAAGGGGAGAVRGAAAGAGHASSGASSLPSAHWGTPSHALYTAMHSPPARHSNWYRLHRPATRTTRQLNH